MIEFAKKKEQDRVNRCKIIVDSLKNSINPWVMYFHKERVEHLKALGWIINESL